MGYIGKILCFLPFQWLNKPDLKLFPYLIEPFWMDETLQTPADVVKGTPLYRATSSESVLRSGWTVSQTFFFGFKTSSGSPSNPGKVTLSPTRAPLGGSTNSTYQFNTIQMKLYQKLSYKANLSKTMDNCGKKLGTFQSLTQKKKKEFRMRDLLFDILLKAKAWEGNKKILCL